MLNITIIKITQFTDTNAHNFVDADKTPETISDVEKHIRKLGRHIYVRPSTCNENLFLRLKNECEIYIISEWNLTDSIRQRIQYAQEKHVKRSKNLDFGTVQYTQLNRDSIKRYKLSPDAIMQLSIQLAFYSQYREFVPTYEARFFIYNFTIDIKENEQ